MPDRKITVLGVRPIHPGRGADSHIELRLRLDYLKGEPVECVQISPFVARELAEEALVAARIIDRVNADRKGR